MGGNSARTKITDNDIRSYVPAIGFSATAKKFNVNLRNLYARAAKLGVQSCMGPGSIPRPVEDHAPVLQYQVKNGVVIIGSDAHIWPGPMSTAMRAYIRFCKELRPAIAILNGDVLDFPQVSRHPPIGHNKLPELQDEIEAAKEQLHQIALATPRSCKLVWTLGNHDARYETRLATVAPEYAKLHGHSLKDHFPEWAACWRADINGNVTVKHRHKNGTHATHTSTMWAGKTMVTAHLHSQKITPFTDYNGTRYGVDTGCLADPNARAFVDYTEAGPLNWRSGFAVLTFKDGHLLPPELVTVWDGEPNSVTFRGEVIRV